MRMQHASVIYLAEIGLECPREKYSLERRQYKQQYKHHSTSSKEDFFDTVLYPKKMTSDF